MRGTCFPYLLFKFKFVVFLTWLTVPFARNIDVKNDKTKYFKKTKADFENWLLENHIIINKNVKIVRSGKLTKVRGIEATGVLEKETMICQIPLSKLINIEHALLDEIIGPILEKERYLSDLFGMALYLYKLLNYNLNTGAPSSPKKKAEEALFIKNVGKIR